MANPWLSGIIVFLFRYALAERQHTTNAISLEDTADGKLQVRDPLLDAVTKQGELVDADRFVSCTSVPYERVDEPLGVSAPGWQCSSTRLAMQHSLCDFFVPLSCTKKDHTGQYTNELCDELAHEAQVDHAAFQQPIRDEICPAFEEACSFWCGGKPECTVSMKGTAVQLQCTTEFCMANFPLFSFDNKEVQIGSSKRRLGFLRPSDKAGEGCSGRLHYNGQVGYTVLTAIAEYRLKERCCSQSTGSGDEKKYKWMKWEELEPARFLGIPGTSFLTGTRVCPTGWSPTQATTPDECNQLN